MWWHIVRFPFREDVSDEDRTFAEDELRGIADLVEEIRVLRVSRDPDNERVVFYLTGYSDREGFKTYAASAAHHDIRDRMIELCDEQVRFDFVTDDPSDALPRIL